MKTIELNQAELKNFGTPDEVREFPVGRLELVRIGDTTVGRGTFQPGWHWAESVKPIAHTHSCEAPHFQYQVSGVLRVRMDDGTEFDCKAGDAWVVGDEPVVVVDFEGMMTMPKAMDKTSPSPARRLPESGEADAPKGAGF